MYSVILQLKMKKCPRKEQLNFKDLDLSKQGLSFECLLEQSHVDWKKNNCTTLGSIS